MTNYPLRISEELFVSESLKFIINQSVQGLFITNKNQTPIGFVHFHDLIKVLKD